ncbi:RNA helicase [Trifolium repens]|nr:RNA helicase [Trifolium repens]
MARGPISSLFYLCTRKKRYFSRFKALLINQSLISSSNSQFYDPFRPFSTHLVNPRFVPGLSQSLNLSGCRNLPMRPFSTGGEEGGEETDFHSELKTGVGENVDFELGNEETE